jgi:hypothetical protein
MGGPAVSITTMTRACRWTLAIYPRDVRAMYEAELAVEFEQGLRSILWLLIDGLAERAATLYSHPSFRGRRTPNPGQVRPPNMSKSEWYGKL